MTTAFALTVLGLLCTTPDGVAAGGDPSPALVVVALPANADHAILEASSRLGGEATSVGFDVRFVDAGADAVVPDRLEGLAQGMRAAAVVAFSGTQGATQPGHSLDVLFLDRSTGRTFAERFVVADEESEERAEVIVAVRAVDFIRARMLDALVRRSEPAAPPEVARPAPRGRAVYAGAGLGVLGTFSGFAPSVAPKIELAYEPADWLRLGATGFGFGSRPDAESALGRVELEQRYLGASLTALGPPWHRLRLALELGAGAYWMQVRGIGRSPSPSTSERLWSAAMVSSLGVSWALSKRVLLDVRAGTLWLQEKAEIRGTELEHLGTVGRPSWSSSALLGVAY